MKNKFISKSDTLAKLEGLLKNACVLPQFSFTSRMWNISGKDIDKLWFERPDWANGALIVRSSAQVEDSDKESLAGHFKTVMNVTNKSKLCSAIEEVCQSFVDNNPQNKIFIQPMLKRISVSGVAFTKDPSNASHYTIINYDNQSCNSDAVTSGTSNDLKIFYYTEGAPFPKQEWLSKLLLLIKELKNYFSNDRLDIEFAYDESGQLYLFQVRPLIMQCEIKFSEDQHSKILSEIEDKFNSLSKPHPYLLGEKSVYGVMPDWNQLKLLVFVLVH